MTSGATPVPDVLHFVVRDEAPDDAMAIGQITQAAFLDQPFSRQTEHQIVRVLREAGALKLSLVATLEGRVVGHVAFSPVMVGAQDPGWWAWGRSRWHRRGSDRVSGQP